MENRVDTGIILSKLEEIDSDRSKAPKAAAMKRCHPPLLDVVSCAIKKSHAYLSLGAWVGTSLNEFNDSVFLIKLASDMEGSLPELYMRS